MPAKSGRRGSRKGKAAPRKAEVVNHQQRVMAMLSDMRGGLLSKLGSQYSGARDVYKAAGYPKELKFEDYWAFYKRGDVAGRIVDMPARTTWRTPPEVFDGESEEDDSEFNVQFAEMAKRLRLWHQFSRVDRLAGIGHYAVLVIGDRRADDVALKMPLVDAKGEDIVYIGVYHQGNAAIEKWDRDPRSPRFGLPELYKLTASAHKTFGNSTLIVHESRVLHVAEDCLEDDVHGRPRLERTYNRLFDLDKVAASTGEAYWNMVNRVLQASVDKEMEIPEGESEAFFKELDEKLSSIYHDMRRTFYGQGVDLDWLGSDTPNVSQVADFYFSLIAGSTGIPKRILFGSEMGELASSQDQENFYGGINERQEQFAEPQLLRAFINKMIALGALPKPRGDDYTIVWPTLFEESETDIASANLKRAQTAKELTPVGGNPMTLVEIDDERNVWLIPRGADDELPPLPPFNPNEGTLEEEE